MPVCLTIKHAFGRCGCAPIPLPPHTTSICGTCDDDSTAEEPPPPPPTDEPPPGDAPPPVKRAADGKFKCSGCDYKTKKKGNLTRHLAF